MRIARLGVLVLAFVLAGFRGPGSGVKEYEVKAAFLYNFAKFVTCPESAFTSPEAPFVIGVLGEDPFGSTLDLVLKGKKTGKREIVVERYATLADVRKPHMLFVSSSQSEMQAEITRVFKYKPVFLISDSDGAAEKGSTANFFVEKHSVRFAINTEVAKASQLQISSQLLKLAKLVP